jgi:hypothetical protein
MGGETRVDAEQIKRGGEEVRTAAQGLRSQLQEFQQRLAAYGEPWGQDDIGSLIGGCYWEIYEMAMECYEDNIEEMEDHADRVGAMASTYIQAENSSTDSVNRVRDILG